MQTICQCPRAFAKGLGPEAAVLHKPYGYDDIFRAMADTLGEPA
jgi:hypothetical protein